MVHAAKQESEVRQVAEHWHFVSARLCGGLNQAADGERLAGLQLDLGLNRLPIKTRNEPQRRVDAVAVVDRRNRRFDLQVNLAVAQHHRQETQLRSDVVVCDTRTVNARGGAQDGLLTTRLNVGGV